MGYTADNLREIRHITHYFLGKDDRVGDYFTGRLSLVNQNHTARAVLIDGSEDEMPQADGMVTKTRGLILGIRTADCVPILLADSEKDIIGACHAGWRGAFSGVIQNTLSKMVELGASRNMIVSAIGPAIAQKSYEVDRAYRNGFLNSNKENECYFIPGSRRDHHLFDLPRFCYDILKKERVVSISRSPINTYEQEDDYFSYRRSCHRGLKRVPGNQISAIALS